MTSVSENGKPLLEAAEQKANKEGLGWIEWLMGWFYLAYEMLFQRIIASNLPNPMPLPPVNDLTFIVTGSTSGISMRKMHNLGFVDPEDMNVTSGKRKFTSMVGYSSSKLAEVMFSSVLNKKLPSEAGINIACVSPGIVHTNVARDLPKIVQAAYHFIPYFIFSPEEGSRSTLFAATDPQLVDYCESLKADDWPVCAFINQDCRPANPSEEAHNVETASKVWEKTLELIGLPADAVERLIEGEEVKCRYEAAE